MRFRRWWGRECLGLGRIGIRRWRLCFFVFRCSILSGKLYFGSLSGRRRAQRGDKDRIPGSSFCFSSYNDGVETEQRARVLSWPSCSAAMGAGKGRLWRTTTKRLIDSRLAGCDNSAVTPTLPVTTRNTEVESLLSAQSDSLPSKPRPLPGQMAGMCDSSPVF